LISFSNDCSSFLKKFKIKGPLVQGFWKISKINSNFGFKFFWKEPNWFYGRTIKEPKIWGLGSLINSFGFLRSIVMNENQSSNFLKIVNHGSIISKPYLLVLFSKKREYRTMFCFGKCWFSKWQKIRVLKAFNFQSKKII
jgi:hypothetical protein